MDKDIPLWKLKQEAREYIAKCDAEHETGGLTMEKDYKPISDKHLLELHMITAPKKDSMQFFGDVYSAVSELIDRRKASGEWRGLIDDGHKNED